MTERAVSFAVLAVLAAALAHVLARQGRVNPAVLIATTASLDGGAGPGMPVAATGNLLASWPAGLRTMSAAEHFSAETLSDKIDGKAELYFSAGFVGLSCQRVALAAAPDSWMEVFVFDMGEPANAFSVYSAQKRRDAADAGIGDYGYTAGNQLGLVHGRYYLEAVATDAGVATMGAATALGASFVDATPVEAHADVAAVESLFPPDGLVPGSVTLLRADVFGFDRLSDVFVARHRDGADEVALFIARRETPAAAGELAAAFRGFLVGDCGGTPQSAPESLPGAVMVDLGGVFECVLVSGPYMAGVHEAPSREAAERWAGALAERIRGRAGP